MNPNQEVNNMFRNKQMAEVITSNQALQLIEQSIGDEKEDELFYEILRKQAKTAKEKEIIEKIRDDEKKHNKILREIYTSFTGKQYPENNQIKNEMILDESYYEKLERALLGELEAIEKYRKIMGMMPAGPDYVLLMSIMTDEIRHSSLYNYLIQLQNNNNNN